jgi:hypothetical protein
MTFHDAPTNIPDPEVEPKAKRRKFASQWLSQQNVKELCS